MKLIKTSAWTLAVGLFVPSAACSKVEAPAPAVSQTDAVASVPADPYQAEIRKFQQDRETALKTDTGWLTIAGLFFLSQPVSTFGSSPLNDIVLAAGAPDRAGTFELQHGKVHVAAAPGVTFMLNDTPVTAKLLASDAEEPIGSRWRPATVGSSERRPAIHPLEGQEQQAAKEFTGTSWFPINPAHRVEATYTPYEMPKTAEVPNILGDADRLPVPAP